MGNESNELISLIRDIINEKCEKLDGTVWAVVTSVNADATINAYILPDTENITENIQNPNNVYCEVNDVVLIYKVRSNISNSFVMANKTRRGNYTQIGTPSPLFYNVSGSGEPGPAGPAGPQGEVGVTPNISVAATSLSSSASATATRSGTDEEPLITFGIPRGKSFQNIGTFSIEPSEWSALSDATPYTVQATTTVTLETAVEEDCPIMISFDDVISSAGVVLASATGTTTLTLVFYAISTPSNGITGTLGGTK